MFESLSPELIGAARLFFAVALAVTCLALLWEGVRRMRRERGLTRQLDELSEFTSSDTAQAANPLFHPEDADGGRLVGMLTRFLPRREDLRRLLERADVDWGAGTFVLLTVGLGAGAGLGASLLTVGPFGPVAAAAGGATLPYLYLRRRRIRRAAAFEEHFPEAIELLSRSLRAGHALLNSCNQAPSPVCSQTEGGAYFRAPTAIARLSRQAFLLLKPRILLPPTCGEWKPALSLGQSG